MLLNRHFRPYGETGYNIDVSHFSNYSEPNRFQWPGMVKGKEIIKVLEKQVLFRWIHADTPLYCCRTFLFRWNRILPGKFPCIKQSNTSIPNSLLFVSTMQSWWGISSFPFGFCFFCKKPLAKLVLSFLACLAHFFSQDLTCFAFYELIRPAKP